MYRVASLLYFVLITTASVPYWPGLDNGNLGKDLDFPLHVRSDAKSEEVWVLELNSEWDLKMRPATPEEEDNFEDNNRRLMEFYKNRQNAKNWKSLGTSRKDEGNSTIKKEDILRILNKFALSTSHEPDAYLSEYLDEPSIALFFKGPYTSLTVTAEGKQWNYFIAPPSPLPSWFYEPSTRVIPKEVEQPFYNALGRLLRLFLSHPV